MHAKKNVSRRQFLKQGAGVVGAALALPTIVPAQALGRDGWVAPSERINMGFIGIGGQGGGHLLGGAWTYQTGGYTARKDVQVLAACDVWQDRRENAARKVNEHYAEVYGKGSYRACEAYVDFRNVLERDDIDAVLIASPGHWHAIMAIMAAEAGKDVYCEKPTACSIKEAQAVEAAVRRHGRVYQAGTQQRSEYNSLFRRACEFVRAGRIGTLKEIWAYRQGGGIEWPARFGPAQPIPEALDWDLYLGPAPDLPYDGISHAYRFDFGEINWGQHHYDIVQWAAGADETGPVELFMDQGVSCYRYASGVVVYGRPYPGEAVGGEGGACFVGTAGRIAVDRSNMVADPPEIIREPLRPSEPALYHATSHSGNFIECIRSRGRTICNEAVAHRSASALLLGGITLKLNRTLKYDPQAEQFLNDDEANRMLSIATRAPWRV